MPNKYYLLLILPMCAILFSLLFFSSCKKPDSVSAPTCDTCLTPFMTPGFACRINGKPFIAKIYREEGVINSDFSYNKQSLIVTGVGKYNPEITSFSLSSLIDTGLYYFPNMELTITNAKYFDWYGAFEFSAVPIQKGYVHITRLDSVKMSVAGTFEFELYSIGFKDTVRITDGRFYMLK